MTISPPTTRVSSLCSTEDPSPPHTPVSSAHPISGVPVAEVTTPCYGLAALSSNWTSNFGLLYCYLQLSHPLEPLFIRPRPPVPFQSCLSKTLHPRTNNLAPMPRLLPRQCLARLPPTSPPPPVSPLGPPLPVLLPVLVLHPAAPTVAPNTAAPTPVNASTTAVPAPDVPDPTARMVLAIAPPHLQPPFP